MTAGSSFRSDSEPHISEERCSLESLLSFLEKRYSKETRRNRVVRPSLACRNWGEQTEGKANEVLLTNDKKQIFKDLDPETGQKCKFCLSPSPTQDYQPHN